MEQNFNILEVTNLLDGRNKLTNTEGKSYITNSSSSLSTYGIFAVIFMLKKLQNEFSNKVIDIKLNVKGDLPSYITALKLGYKVSYS